MASRFFVLNSGRAGSKTIATLLSKYENCVCLHHPKPELIVESSVYWCEKTGRDEIESALKRRGADYRNGGAYGEVNLQMTLIADVIRDCFPDAKFLWLIRDGRDSIASMFGRGWFDPEVDAARRPLWSEARLHGDCSGEYTSEEWASASRFEKCCWIWREYNRIAEKFLGNLPSGFGHRVRLNELQDQLPGLEAALGLVGERPLVQRTHTARQPVDYWAHWNAEDREIFERVCGDDMDRWFPAWRSENGEWQEISLGLPLVPLRPFFHRVLGKVKRIFL